MRKQITSWGIILLVMTGCGGNKELADSLITVDVTASYPEKELVLQDFMDVEYIPLETTDDFITKGTVGAIGKDILLVTNQWRDGDIFVFDRNGKGLRKINRFGQGAEEYPQMTEIVLDENANEMFVVAYTAKKIWVYDLEGNFRRSFKFADTGYYSNTFNYDRDYLISYKSYPTAKENERACHILISKQDGSVAHEIRIPSKEFKTPVVTKDGMTVMPEFYQTFPNDGKWALVNTSSDTVFNYLPDGGLIPFIVRTPAINTMETEIFLFPGIITDRYCFMRIMKKELDFKTFKGFPSTDLVYDKQEKSLFEGIVYNADFTNKKQVPLGFKLTDQNVAFVQKLEAAELVDAYEKGELKGKLKEIAAELNEESNPVIMLVKYKE